MNCWLYRCCIFLVLILSACQYNPVIQSNARIADLSRSDGWVVQALGNSSFGETASESATTLLETQLRRLDLLDGRQGPADARYRVSGEVSSWHYRGNVSPRPEVAFRIDVYDLQSNTVVWSEAVHRVGKRRETITRLADQLMSDLVERLPLVSESKSRPVSTEPAMQAARAAVESFAQRTFSEPMISPSQPLAGRSVAFYYGENPPVDELTQFDRVILEPDNIDSGQLRKFRSSKAKIYAYVSVGEAGAEREFARELKSEWILGKNSTWNSQVLDLANPAWQKFLEERIANLYAAGYQGVFLDTMDSYNIVARSDEARAAQRAGLIALIARVAQRLPELAIITNRGFEILDAIAPFIEAVAAESLYASWNNDEQTYTTVSEVDRQWLLNKLHDARNRLNLDVIAIDYLPPEKRAQAREVAALIAEQGFIPWVANPELDYVGVGALEVLPRKVLMLFNSAEDGPLQVSPVHRFLATPLEYLGYVPEYLDIARETLPAGELKGVYAGVVMWPSRPSTDVAFRAWIQAQLDDRLPLALMGMPPFALDDAMTQALGIELVEKMDIDSAVLTYSDDYVKPERSLGPRIDFLSASVRALAPRSTAHMSYQDNKGIQTDVVVTGEFGGFAWQPGLVVDGLDYETYWVIDPFRFLETALQLPKAPMPDVTTESGRRMWLAHIDGDALPSWAEMQGGQLGAEVIHDRILVPYPLPHTISVVEGEMTQFANYEDRRQRMFDIVRRMFELDHVELASHTFSHPFKWGQLESAREPGRYNLKIDGYEYSAERETAGSISFIDKNLAPPGKRTEVMLWSGDALPNEEDLAVLDRLGIPNMNGGLTSATNTKPSMTLVSPMARPVGPYLQVYAPIMNENVYTNDWLGPFDGFRHVIETFELTEHPRRLKPINIYYHFYTGTKISAIKALRDVYEWTLTQDVYPLYVSDFSIKVPDYRQAGVARYLSGEWKLSRLGNVRSIRLLGKAHWPQLQDSQGVVGTRQLHDGIYVHTDGSDSVRFRLVDEQPADFHLVSSNGRVVRWDKSPSGLTFRMVAEVPVVVELGGALTSTCRLLVGNGNRAITGVLSADKTMTYTFTSRDTGDAILSCQA
jgi:polysaccharide biosynthesis protein PelA